MKLLLILLLLPGAQEGEHDVIHRKDGRKHSGRILSETTDQVVFEVIIKGSKGQTLGTGKLTIPKKDILRITRATVEGRKKAAAKATAFTNRRQRYVEAMEKIDARPINFEGRSGFQIDGSHYILYSTCEEAFSKDVAYALEEIFAAYRKFFDIRRNAASKVAVYVFADRSQYSAFQTRTLGGAVPNLAYYHPEKNYVAAYNMIQKEAEAKIRAEILKLEKEISRFRSEVITEERRVDKQVRDLKQQLADAVARAKRAIRTDGQGNVSARLREIDRIKNERLRLLAAEEKQYRRELSDYKKKATDAISRNRKIIDGNRKVLRNQNAKMFETLFHEGFHAFATNYLWEGAGRLEFPRWLHEGMASYFEMSVVEAGDLVHGGLDPDRLAALRSGAVSTAYGWLKKIVEGGPDLFVVTHTSQLNRATTSYAQAWLLSHYLSGRVGREKIAAYVADVLAGKDRLKSFERMMGKSWREVQRDVQDYLIDLK